MDTDTKKTTAGSQILDLTTSAGLRTGQGAWPNINPYIWEL